MRIVRNRNSLEYQLVRWLAKVDLDKADKYQLHSVLVQHLRWRLLEKIAYTHGVGGLLYQNLRNLQKEHEFLNIDISFFEKIYYGNVANALTTKCALRLLFKVFNDAKIPVLLYKGIELVENVYRNFGLRGFADVDIMVLEEDVPKVQDILKSQGYSNLSNHAHLFSNGTVEIDLHLEPFGYSRIEARRFAFEFAPETLWKEASLKSLFGYSIYTFSLEDELLVLIVHAVKHSFQKMIWSVDIAEIIRQHRADINWNSFVHKVAISGLEKPSYTILQWAHEQMGVSIPKQVLQELHPRQKHYWQNLLYQKIQAGSRVERSAELIYLFSIPGFFKKLRFLREAMFPGKEIRAQIFAWYNTPMFFLFYPLRLFQMFRFGFRLCFQLLIK